MNERRLRTFTRRETLGLAGAGALSLLLPKAPRAAEKPRSIPIALQLYSIRQDCANDFDAALARVAELGFAGVEFAGYHRYAGNAGELRKRLDDLGLKAAATHIATGTLRGNALKATIEFHQTLGCRFLIVPGDGDFTHPEKSKAFAELMNQTAETLKPLGMACGYHNHTREFAKDGEKTYWDLFAERTRPEVILQQDCGWTAAAGLNPVELIRRYPGRTRVTHFKPTVVRGDTGKKAILGQDSVEWTAVIAACRAVGGTEWITLEQETYPEGKPPLECVQLSLAGLKRLLADPQA